jgi:hypothetical protein
VLCYLNGSASSSKPKTPVIQLTYQYITQININFTNRWSTNVSMLNY